MSVAAPRTAAGRRLLESASALFYRDGITAVGVAGIADAAGVTKKTLYDCYGSKANLVAAYLTHRHETWWAYLQHRLADAPAPRVLAVVDAYLEHPRLDLDRGCGFQRGAAELPEGHPGLAVIRDHKAAVRTEIARLLADDLPEARDVDRLAEHVYLLLEGAAFQRGIDGHPQALHRTRGLVSDLVTHADH
ncbi:TetR/AcrR family transcriptional regulator [Pseudonocardia acaciae]|uniref:TetR/AcrR family transcriptional regulator n=1 Tax=Pseudonocardia acaciae TaxID=551276 RepID=UPI000562F8FB|nr:TetR/AcrR family transcriptional regulator [Pseudonocardia acaciae]